MRRALCALGGALAALAAAPEPGTAEQGGAPPAVARCFPGETWTLRIRALGVTGAHATVEMPLGCGGAEAYVAGRVQTTRLISLVWRVRDRILTVLDGRTGATLRTLFEEDENGRHETRTDSFEPGAVVTRWELPPGRVVRTPAPQGALDPFTVLMRLRAAPLAPGDRYQFPVFSRDTVYDGTVVVLARELTIALGETTRVVHLHATFMEGPRPSRVHADIWLTDDDRRLPVRVEAGTRFGYLVSVLDAVTGVP
ncbi:MAG: DUF3108 domain-containing protein [Deltaproteobacteria bacterium]|nr:DUF3108 domain-containing protein [Deltaproteobacteria bacterium]